MTDPAIPESSVRQRVTLGVLLTVPGLVTVAAVAIVGVAIGAAAGLLTLMLYGVEHLALGYADAKRGARNAGGRG